MTASKTNHHGVKTGCTQRFTDFINPRRSTISSASGELGRLDMARATLRLKPSEKLNPWHGNQQERFKQNGFPRYRKTTKSPKLTVLTTEFQEIFGFFVSQLSHSSKERDATAHIWSETLRNDAETDLLQPCTRAPAPSRWRNKISNLKRSHFSQSSVFAILVPHFAIVLFSLLCLPNWQESHMVWRNPPRIHSSRLQEVTSNNMIFKIIPNCFFVYS